MNIIQPRNERISVEIGDVLAIKGYGEYLVCNRFINGEGKKIYLQLLSGDDSTVFNYKYDSCKDMMISLNKGLYGYKHYPATKYSLEITLAGGSQ
jgi:hypothetical protein